LHRSKNRYLLPIDIGFGFCPNSSSPQKCGSRVVSLARFVPGGAIDAATNRFLGIGAPYGNLRQET
jgi:hypothetical protein